MWERLKRIFRSIFGGIISSMEDPVAILEQNIRDMQDQVPQMNAEIAKIKANVTLLDRDKKKLEDKDKELISKMKAAINQNRDDLAAGFAVERETLVQSLARTNSQLIGAEKAYAKALEVKKAFLIEKERKTQEAMRAIQTARQAEWQSKVADSMEKFSIGGVDSTHDEMMRRIEEESAVNEARLDLALSNVNTDKMKIEEEASSLRGMDMVKQMKLEMGLLDAEDGGEAGQKEKA